MNDLASALPMLLGIAWLVPLASFTLILFFGPRMGKHGVLAGHVGTGAILTSCVLSLVALFGLWIPNYGLYAPQHHAAHGDHHDEGHSDESHGGDHSDGDHASTQKSAL